MKGKSRALNLEGHKISTRAPKVIKFVSTHPRMTCFKSQKVSELTFNVKQAYYSINGKKERNKKSKSKAKKITLWLDLIMYM